MPVCVHVENGEPCGEPARWEIHQPADNPDPTYVCNPHFFDYGQIGNSVFDLAEPPSGVGGLGVA